MNGVFLPHLCLGTRKKTLENSADPDQTSQNMASAQGLYYLHMTNGRPSGAMVLGNVSGPGGVLLIWIIVGQGPIALAVGAGWGCLDIFSRQSFLFSSSLGRPDID